MDRYSFNNNMLTIRMTENKLYSKNTHTDPFPINEQLIPYAKKKRELPKEAVILSKKSSWELASRVMHIVLGLFTMTILIYPVLILPGLILVILPLEVVIADRVYGDFNKAKYALKAHRGGMAVTYTINDNIDQDNIRVSVYGKRAPA
jgi:hypothetical protein